jgi:hypothetical protein
MGQFGGQTNELPIHSIDRWSCSRTAGHKVIDVIYSAGIPCQHADEVVECTESLVCNSGRDMGRYPRVYGNLQEHLESGVTVVPHRRRLPFEPPGYVRLEYRACL